MEPLSPINYTIQEIPRKRKSPKFLYSKNSWKKPRPGSTDGRKTRRYARRGRRKSDTPISATSVARKSEISETPKSETLDTKRSKITETPTRETLESPRSKSLETPRKEKLEMPDSEGEEEGADE